MKKLNDFEYDLWTTEVRVRLTKEECQVDRETFRLLRAEEKRLRRERMPEKKKTVSNQPFSMEQTRRPLSLQTLCPGDDEEEGEFWLIDPNNMEDIITTKLLEEAFLALQAGWASRNMRHIMVFHQPVSARPFEKFKHLQRNFSEGVKKAFSNVRC